MLQLSVEINRGTGQTLTCDCSSDTQHELLEACETSANRGMRNLGLVQGDDHDQEANSQACEASSRVQVADCLSTGLQGTANAKDRCTDQDGESSSKPVAGRASEESAKESTSSKQ